MGAESFGRQNYGKIKKSCLSRGILWEDKSFPPSYDSLKVSRQKLPGRVEWKRPPEICDSPKLVEGRVSRLSATQGMLGNCWFVAAISALASYVDLWNNVVPDIASQEWDHQNKKGYAGIFHFTFYHFGKWVDVVVDDRLPTVNNRLIFTHSESRNEFWCALLEKAYAKLCGSYANLESGNLVDALVDFTGGFGEILELQERSSEETTKSIFTRMTKELQSHSLMCCAIKPMERSQMEKRTRMGLVKGHAYCVTALKKISLAGTGLFSLFKGRKKIKMIRLRNPWGEKEWLGAFSDGSPEWRTVNESDRKKMGLTFEEDGEFWMTFDDFCEYFTTLSICHLVKTSWFTFGKRWYETANYGEWISKGERAGGCGNHKTFLQNPQFRLDIPQADDTLMIMLQQKDPRSTNSSTLSIGLSILKVEENRIYRLHATRKQISTSDYMKSRNIFHKCTLTTGRYVLLPTTYQPNYDGMFFLRIFSTNGCQINGIKLDVPPPPFWPWSAKLKTATYIQVKKAAGLKQVDGKDPDTYCLVTWGNLKETTHVVQNSTSPRWDFGLTVYKSKLTKPLNICVLRKSALHDTVLGVASLDVVVNSKSETYNLRLLNPKPLDKDSKASNYAGTVQVVIFTTTNFMAI